MTRNTNYIKLREFFYITSVFLISRHANIQTRLCSSGPGYSSALRSVDLGRMPASWDVLMIKPYPMDRCAVTTTQLHDITAWFIRDSCVRTSKRVSAVAGPVYFSHYSVLTIRSVDLVSNASEFRCSHDDTPSYGQWGCYHNTAPWYHSTIHQEFKRANFQACLYSFCSGPAVLRLGAMRCSLQQPFESMRD